MISIKGLLLNINLFDERCQRIVKWCHLVVSTHPGMQSTGVLLDISCTRRTHTELTALFNMINYSIYTAPMWTLMKEYYRRCSIHKQINSSCAHVYPVNTNIITIPIGWHGQWYTNFICCGRWGNNGPCVVVA